MCGIIGIFSKNIDKEEFKRALNSLVHRGPDDSGVYDDGNIMLGHRRLSIIDLSKNGKQPMFNENEDICVVYNGEIYNFKEIKKELEKKKHKFKSNSDTEVILHAYEEYGDKCVERFNGMFAFAIWDSKKKRIFIARDRVGIKPLYYYQDDEKFIFASEIKAILEFQVKREVNEGKIRDYINYCIQIGNETLFKGIYSFPAGNTGVFENNHLRIKEYWDAEYSEKKSDEKENIQELKNILEESVKNQLIADVPVGTFLSGGLDSSTITCLAQKNIGKNLQTFTAGFDIYPEEINAAESLCEEIGAKNNSVELNSEMFVKTMPKLIWNYDLPISFASSIPLYHVSKLAKQKVKVVLTGEGADEMFAGYRRYYFIQKALSINKIARFIPGRRILNRMLDSSLTDPRRKKMLALALEGRNFDYFTGINAIIGKERDKILKIEKRDNSSAEVERLFNLKATSFTNRLLYLDMKTYLPELLLKQDRMSMAASIESRVPFLDNRVIDFSQSIPSSQKLNGKNGKYILRKAVSDILPKEIIKRKKIGFSVPLNQWFRKELNGWLKEELNSGFIEKYLDRNYVNRLVEKQKSKNNSLQLWTLVNMQLWHKQFFKD